MRKRKESKKRGLNKSQIANQVYKVFQNLINQNHKNSHFPVIHATLKMKKKSPINSEKLILNREEKYKILLTKKREEKSKSKMKDQNLDSFLQLNNKRKKEVQR